MLPKGVSSMARNKFEGPTNPYHYALHCIGGKWKMTILHEIETYGSIHFNQTLKVLPISEKVLSQQLKELIEDGLVHRNVDSSVYPPAVEYVLTDAGAELVPVLDILYIWSIRQMDANGLPIDADAFVVHQSEKFVNELNGIMSHNGFLPDAQRQGAKKKHE
jgi:DNA-binding HxlR family transcriptional regulator